MRPRLVGINHVALQVDDLEQAVELYCTLFEPTAVDRSEPDAAFLEIGDQFIALFERGSREEEPHFGLVVDDKEAARRVLEDAGVEILPGHRRCLTPGRQPPLAPKSQKVSDTCS